MNALIHGLSGYIPIRDGDSLCYCWREAAQSLLPIVDELILCDSDSTDGTREEMELWAREHPKIRVINYPWPRLPTPDEVERDDPHRPKGDPRMLLAWIEFARQHCQFDHQITLDADEVLSPSSYPEVKRAVEDSIPRWMRRINFWGDPYHEAPHGTVCGERVVRIGPTRMMMVSDEPRPEGEPEIRTKAIDGPGLKIFHLGFLRNQNAFLKKSRVVQAAIHNCYDPRLRAAEKTGDSWVSLSPFPADKPLLGYVDNDIPEFAKRWIRSQGHNCP